MPPTMTGTSPSPAAREPVEHVGHQLHVRAGQDREADAVHVLGHGRRDDLLGREPDALVDHLEARVARTYGDLLGAVGVTVEPRLADQQPQPAAQLLAGRPHPVADGGQLGAGLGHADGAADAGGSPELAEHLAQRAGPLPRRRARRGPRRGSASIRLASVLAAAASAASASATSASSRWAFHAATRVERGLLGLRVGGHDRARRGRRSAATARWSRTG